EGLMSLTRIESGRMSIEPTEIEIEGLVCETVEEIRPHAAQKQLAVEVRGQGGVILNDRRLVRLIIINLLANAIKFTDRGQVCVQLSRRATRCRIEVSDTGRGIPVEEQARIFEPFEQLGASSNQLSAGVGLGLTIVRELVDAMGGTLELTSRMGTGSTFAVEL